MVFQCINIRQVPWEVLKTAAFGLGFQQLPRDLANVNAWKTMFDPFIINKDEYTWLILLYTTNYPKNETESKVAACEGAAILVSEQDNMTNENEKKKHKKRKLDNFQRVI